MNYYDIIEKTEGNAWALLKKKNTLSPPQEIIMKYEKICE